MSEKKYGVIPPTQEKNVIIPNPDKQINNKKNDIGLGFTTKPSPTIMATKEPIPGFFWPGPGCAGGAGSTKSISVEEVVL